jgi:hypothetical protein
MKTQYTVTLAMLAGFGLGGRTETVIVKTRATTRKE